MKISEQNIATANKITNEKKRNKCGLCQYFHIKLYVDGESINSAWVEYKHEIGYCTLYPKWERVAGIENKDISYCDDFIARWEHFCGQFAKAVNPILYKYERDKGDNVIIKAEKILEAIK